MHIKFGSEYLMDETPRENWAWLRRGSKTDESQFDFRQRQEGPFLTASSQRLTAGFSFGDKAAIARTLSFTSI